MDAFLICLLDWLDTSYAVHEYKAIGIILAPKISSNHKLPPLRHNLYMRHGPRWSREMTPSRLDVPSVMFRSFSFNVSFVISDPSAPCDVFLE